MKRAFSKFVRKTSIATIAVLFVVSGFSVAQASMEEALYAARNRNYDEAFKLFMAEAEQGNAEAQYRVASMYNAGNGTKKNKELALTWFQMSAELGHAKAKAKLARIKPASNANTVRPDALLKASRKGELAAVSQLIKNGHDINFKDPFGVTALMEAVLQNHVPVIDHLLKNKADPNLANNDGDTALLIATSLNKLKSAEMLLKHNADVDVRDANKSTPLIIAAIREKLAISELMLQNGADIYLKADDGRTVYDIAAGSKNEKLIALIKRSGGEKLAKLIEEREASRSGGLHASDALNKRGWSPVMYAAWRGDQTGLNAALKLSPNLGQKDSAGMTALALAAQGGHLSAVDALIKAGASLECKDTALHPMVLATKQGHVSVVGSLVSQLKSTASCSAMLEETFNQSLVLGKLEIAELFFDNDISIGSKTSTSPLIVMAAKADGTLIDKLIKGGAKVDGANIVGETALMIAARTGNNNAVASLLRHKADINKSDQQGRTALLHAAQNNQTSSVELLIEHGADALRTTKENNSALMLAAERGYVSVVEFLVNYENLDQKNNVGDTALIMAARGGFYNVSDILLKQGANPRVSNNKKQKAQSVVKEEDDKLLALIEEYSSSRSWIQDIF